jgi:hypothetical protein
MEDEENVDNNINAKWENIKTQTTQKVRQSKPDQHFEQFNSSVFVENSQFRN